MPHKSPALMSFGVSFESIVQSVDHVITGLHCSKFLSGYESVQTMSVAFSQCFMSGFLKQGKVGSGNDKVSLRFVLGTLCKIEFHYYMVNLNMILNMAWDD